MTTKHDPVDVLVIGSGMGGAATTKILAEAGLKVVCLEQGRWVQQLGHPHASPDWDYQRLTNWHTAPTVRKLPEDYPVDTTDETPLMWNGVGGSTVHYTATWPRFRPSDFRKGREHGYAPDWPLTYEELEPYYEINDRDCGTSGWVGDPAMPLRKGFSTPTLAPGPYAPLVAKGFDRLGWHWWPMDMAVISQDYDGRKACNHCGNCQSGCNRGSMADVSVTHWPKAIAAGAELRINSRVEQIEVDARGRATGATYIDLVTGVRNFQAADVVIVACNGIGTPRLLLVSENARFPHGLANSNGHVGKHLMHHGLAIVEMWVEQITDTHKGVVSAALICSEFAETDPRRGFINGVTLHVVRMNGAGYQAFGSHSGNTAPWGSEHHTWFRRHFGHGVAILIVGEDLPLEGNCVTLSDTLRDSSGLPAPKVAYRLHPNDRKIVDFGIERVKDLGATLGAFDLKVNDFSIPGKGYAPPAWHLLGTCRMGDDRETSVVNHWHQTWDVPNLYIIDGSVLPTSAAVNPTSTIGALAVRAATHLRDTFASARTATRTMG
ncbi:MAG: GMC family oxidoreductase [Chloroflexota bacterium]|nr:GMC family oxidoreductase [Chloroflexota bacterium]